MSWKWFEKRRTYVDDQGKRIGVSGEDSFIDRIIGRGVVSTNNIAAMVANKTISVSTWEAMMRLEIKNAYIQQYLLGRGGKIQMGFNDYGSIGGMLKEQYAHLSKMAAQMAAGNLTEAQIAFRSSMYIKSSNEAFNRGRARAYGIPDGLLPQFPGDGQTVCLTNCRCRWIIEVVDEGIKWDCFWKLDAAADTCPDCTDNRDTWSPLVITDETA